MCTHCMVHPQVVDVEEDSKMEDVFDESTLVPSANSSLTAAGGGVSQTGATTAEGAKVKKTIVRKRYKWTDEIRCVAFFRMSSSGGGRRQREREVRYMFTFSISTTPLFYPGSCCVR